MVKYETPDLKPQESEEETNARRLFCEVRQYSSGRRKMGTRGEKIGEAIGLTKERAETTLPRTDAIGPKHVGSALSMEHTLAQEHGRSQVVVIAAVCA